MRHKLATLCPETDGLQGKHRIRYKPEGKTQEQQMLEIEELGEKVVLPCLLTKEETITQKQAQIISHIYLIEGFSDEEVYQILLNKRIKRPNT